MDKRIMYSEIYKDIKNLIKNKFLKEHDKLPTEFEFCKNYNTSRITVRRALDDLEKEGIIYKMRGKGTFVAPVQIIQNRSKLSKFYDDVKKSGKNPTSKIISFNRILPTEDLKNRMKLKKDEEVYEIEWIRYADGEPLIYEKIYFPYLRVPELQNYDLENLKLYDILAEKYDVKMTRGKESFTLHTLTGEEAIKLNKKKNDTAMKIEKMVWENKDVLEYTEAIVRGDRFIYTLEYDL